MEGQAVTCSGEGEGGRYDDEEPGGCRFSGSLRNLLLRGSKGLFPLRQLCWMPFWQTCRQQARTLSKGVRGCTGSGMPYRQRVAVQTFTAVATQAGQGAGQAPQAGSAAGPAPAVQLLLEQATSAGFPSAAAACHTSNTCTVSCGSSSRCRLLWRPCKR